MDAFAAKRSLSSVSSVIQEHQRQMLRRSDHIDTDHASSFRRDKIKKRLPTNPKTTVCWLSPSKLITHHLTQLTKHRDLKLYQNTCNVKMGRLFGFALFQQFSSSKASETRLNSSRGHSSYLLPLPYQKSTHSSLNFCRRLLLQRSFPSIFFVR